MKEIVGKALEVLGAEVVHAAGHLQFAVPEDTGLKDLFDHERTHRLIFESGKATHHTPICEGTHFVPGSPLSLGIVSLLEERYAVRHAVINTKERLFVKDVSEQLSIVTGDLSGVTGKRVWTTKVRCYLKLAVVSDELVEDLIVIEVGDGIPARQVEYGEPFAETGRPVKKPHLTQTRLKSLIDQAVDAAETAAGHKLAATDADRVKRLYNNLDRLRAYYRQKQEEVNNADEGEVTAIEAEYQHRRDEEIRKAGVKVRIELVALETLAMPEKHFQLEIRAGEARKQLELVYDLKNSRFNKKVTCESCQKATFTFGLSRSGKVVCADCFRQCAVCDGEIIGHDRIGSGRCGQCDRLLCDEHLHHCDVCREPVCPDHMKLCEEGCRVCQTCTCRCLDCGPDVVYCRDHLLGSEKTVCRFHVAYCVGCREALPASETLSCAACGQNACPSCRAFCVDCGQYFCLNHIEEDRCRTCRKTNAQKDLIELFTTTLNRLKKHHRRSS